MYLFRHEVISVSEIKEKTNVLTLNNFPTAPKRY